MYSIRILQPKMKYPGQKNIPGLIHKIVNQVPPCKEFYEPFAGSAAVSCFLSVLPGMQTKFFVNDIDHTVTANFTYASGSKITNFDALAIIRKLASIKTGKDIFIFIDPPYHHSTRPNNVNLYKREFSNADHIQLLKAVLQLKCNCMIIHPVCDLYEKALSTWRPLTISVRYHNKTSIERLYMNYPDPQQLLTYVYAGKDCWDRQRIKRKGDRTIQRLMTLPAVERNYIIDSILQSFPNH